MKKHNIMNLTFYTIFICYLLMLVTIVFFGRLSFTDLVSGQHTAIRSVNLIPFAQIYEFIFKQEVSATVSILNLIGNIVMFIPLGIYIKVIGTKNSFKKNVVLIMAASLFIELTQLIFGLGACDIDDLLLNTLGGIIGIFIFNLLNLIFHNKAKIKSFITVFSTIIGIPIIVLFLVIYISNP